MLRIAPGTKQTDSQSRATLQSDPERDYPKNLVLVAKRQHGHVRDFRAIAKSIHRRASDIRVTVMADRFYNAWRPQFLRRPTLTFSPVKLRYFQPLRGALRQNSMLSKSEEYTLMDAAGLPTPRWTLLTRENPQPDLSDFGDYVVTKPDCGGRGAEVKIRRRGRVRWCPPAEEQDRALYESGIVVQQFVYTGKWPTCYRVSTLFGQVLYAWKATAATSRRPLLGPNRFREGAEGGGISIVSSGRGCSFELADDADVLDLATRAHAAFPDHPLLAFDIIREVPSGDLYLIEANSCGRSWHFSSPAGVSIQRENDFDLSQQFQGLEVAATTLIDQTRRLAA